MCGRFSFFGVEQFYSRFQIKNRLGALNKRYNITPRQKIPIVTREDNENYAEMMLWGLIPFWAKDPKIGNKMINARADTLSEKPIFKKPLSSRRCLVPVNGFYEWKGNGDGKIPYYIRRKDDDLFGLAGLYDVWRDLKGREVKSFTIITVPPNRVLKNIHNRMPAVLDRKNENKWMDNNISVKTALTYLKPHPAKELKAYEISKRINISLNDDSDIIKPAYGNQ